MSIGSLVVGGFIAVWAIIAIYVLVRNHRNGKNSCGCNCAGCASAKRPNVTIEEDSCDCCKKN